MVRFLADRTFQLRYTPCAPMDAALALLISAWARYHMQAVLRKLGDRSGSVALNPLISAVNLMFDYGVASSLVCESPTRDALPPFLKLDEVPQSRSKPVRLFYSQALHENKTKENCGFVN